MGVEAESLDEPDLEVESTVVIVGEPVSSIYGPAVGLPEIQENGL